MVKRILLIAAAALAGCAPTAQLHLSAGRLGCSTKDIVIGDVDSTRHSETWSASCKGQMYYCSATDDFREVVCKPQLKPTPPAPPASPPPAIVTTPAPDPAAPVPLMP